jgi:hypothetical protein
MAARTVCGRQHARLPGRGPWRYAFTMSDDTENRRYHDMGGLPAGPVENEDHEPDLWEKRVDALMVCLGTSAPGGKGLITVDEIRRAIEDLPPDAYDTMGYYERWVHSLSTILAERGVFTTDELDAKLAEVKARAQERAGGEAAR